MTSIEDTTASLSEVDFPSVTICNVNQVGGEDNRCSNPCCLVNLTFVNMTEQNPQSLLYQCHANIKRKEIVPKLFSIDRCSYQLWKKPVSTGVMVDQYQYQNIVMSLFQVDFLLTS